MKKRAIIFLCATFATIACLGIFAAYHFYKARQARDFIAGLFAPESKPSWRHHLPTSAADIHEWAWADGFLPDYKYLLKAQITEREFHEFVAKLQLTPHATGRQYSEESHWLSWSGNEVDWWDVSPSLDSTYVQEGQDTWTFAKYEKGCLYFKSLNH